MFKESVVKTMSTDIIYKAAEAVRVYGEIAHGCEDKYYELHTVMEELEALIRAHNRMVANNLNV